MTLNINTLSMIKFSIVVEHCCYAECHIQDLHAECRYAECRGAFDVATI